MANWWITSWWGWEAVWSHHFSSTRRPDPWLPSMHSSSSKDFSGFATNAVFLRGVFIEDMEFHCLKAGVCWCRLLPVCCEQPDTPYTEPKPMAHVFVFGKTVVGIPLASSAVSIGCNFVRHFEFGKTLLHSNVNDLRAQAAHARRSQRSTASFVMFDPWGCDLFLEKRRERPLAKWMKQYDWTFKSTWIMLIIVSQVAMQHGLNTVY